MSPSESQLRKAAEAYLATFKDLSLEDALALRAPSCIHVFAPASMDPPPPKNNEELTEHVKTYLHPIFDHFPLAAKEIHINEAGRQATMWAAGTPEFKAAAKGEKGDWNCAVEFIFILDFDENGKIVRVLEFLDSLAMERWKELMMSARQNVGLDEKPW